MEKLTYVKAIENALNGNLTEETVEKLNALKASIAKKNTAERKPTATQKANEEFKSAIASGMESGKAYTITDLIKSVDAISELSNQRVSALLRQLIAEGQVVKTVDKKKSFFSLAVAE